MMSKYCYIASLMIILISISGCSLPPISVLYLTDSKYDDFMVSIDNSTYFLEAEYDLSSFCTRISDSLITYFEIERIDDETFVYDKVLYSDSSFIGYTENIIDTIRISEIYSMELSRATTSEEKSYGWAQVIVWSCSGFISDINSKKEGEALSYKGTLIGLGIGLGIGSLFFFDKNQVYETIYFKHD